MGEDHGKIKGSFPGLGGCPGTISGVPICLDALRVP